MLDEEPPAEVWTGTGYVCRHCGVEVVPALDGRMRTAWHFTAPGEPVPFRERCRDDLHVAEAVRTQK